MKTAHRTRSVCRIRNSPKSESLAPGGCAWRPSPIFPPWTHSTSSPFPPTATTPSSPAAARWPRRRAAAIATAFSISRKVRWARAAQPRFARPKRSGAAAVLGVAVRENLGLPDAGIVNDPATREQLARAIRQLRPQRRDRARARGTASRSSRDRAARARRVLPRRIGQARARCAEASAAQGSARPHVPAGFRAPAFVVDISDEFETEAGSDSLLRLAVRGRDAGRRGVSRTASRSRT